jgi:hypothetical protein
MPVVTAMQRQIDSLGNAGIPVENLMMQLDSLQTAMENVLTDFTARAETIKQTAMNNIQRLGLPEELSEQVENYSSIINRFNLSLPDAEMALPAFGSDQAFSLPSIKDKLPSTIGNIKINGLTKDVDEFAEQVSAIREQLPDSLSAALVAERIEAEASEYLASRFGEMPEVPPIPTDEDGVKEELEKHIREQAVNHFQEHQQKLSAAMDQVNQYKQKFSSAQSLAELPARVPNEMRGKPFTERLIPGITIQTQQRNDWWFDFNPYAGYRFNSHLVAGLGWVQRVAYNFSAGTVNNAVSAYGVRTYTEYRLMKGLLPRLEMEYLNAPVRVPPDFKYARHEWVWSLMAGIKKEYRLSESLRGNMQVLYNVFDPHHKSPYIDRLNVRMGVEYIIKRKNKRTEPSGTPQP